MNLIELKLLLEMSAEQFSFRTKNGLSRMPDVRTCEMDKPAGIPK